MIPGLSLLQNLLLVGFILLLLMIVTAPLETLGWWAGWFGQNDNTPDNATLRPNPAPQAKQWVVYMSGIGDISDEFLFPEEIDTLSRLQARLPEAVIIQDVFPYSVTNTALTGGRAFSWVWKRVADYRAKHGDNAVAYIINFRNVLQVLVSSDPRYGPMYSYGTAKLIRNSLLGHGYPAGSGRPVWLIGFSGGGQITLGAAPYLKAMLGAPVQVISLGGVMCNDPGVKHVAHLYHLYGQTDGVQKLGQILFPGRWPVMRHSMWNTAERAGKITQICIGPNGHNDPGGYFDAGSRLPNGKTHADNTADYLADIIVNGVRSWEI